MQKRFRQLFTRVKEHSSVSYAKVATAGGFCDIDLIIVKATAPDDLSLSEKYINDLLKIFSICPPSFRTFSLSFTRRFGKTHCWRVALKCVLLLHRLLRALPENSPFRSELLWTRSNSLLSLHPCHFRDESSSDPEDYILFIRSYAQFLDEALDCVALDGKATYEEEEEKIPESVSDKMKEVGRLIEVLPQLQSLIDRVMNCKPTGVAARNLIVKIAMKYIIRDSFICYTTFRREIVLVLENLFQMPYRSCMLAFGIYKKAAMQANQLSDFYDWCKALGFCEAYRYPFIDRIPQIQIQALETFLNGMWQLTESSSPGSSPSSFSGSPSTLTATFTEEDGECRQIVKNYVEVNKKWVKFEENVFPGNLKEEEEMKPMIQFEDGENDEKCKGRRGKRAKKFQENVFPRNLEGEEEREPLAHFEDSENDDWEDLLDASVNLPCLHDPESSFSVSSNNNEHGYEYDNDKSERSEEDRNEWKMQVCDPEAVINPFYQPYNMHYYHGLRRM